MEPNVAILQLEAEVSLAKDSWMDKYKKLELATHDEVMRLATQVKNDVAAGTITIPSNVQLHRWGDSDYSSDGGTFGTVILTQTGDLEEHVTDYGGNLPAETTEVPYKFRHHAPGSVGQYGNESVLNKLRETLTTLHGGKT